MTLYLTDGTAPEEIDRAHRRAVRSRRQALPGRARPRIRMRASPTSGKTYAVLERMAEMRHAAARARRDRARRTSTCSTANRYFIDEMLAAAHRALSAPEGGVRAHHHGARGRVRRGRARRGRRHHHAAASPAQSQCDFRGRDPAALLLPADLEARTRPPRPGRRRHRRQSALFPRNRQRAPRARDQGDCLRLRRDVHGARGDRALCGGVRGEPDASIAWRPLRVTSARTSTDCRATRSASP